MQFLQPLLDVLSFAEVADEACEEPSVARNHLSDGQFHGEGRAVAALSQHDPADPDDASLAGGQIAIQIAVMMRAVGLGHQHVHIATDDLVGLPAEQAFGGEAEGLHVPVFGDDHHRVRHGCEDGLEVGFPGEQVSVHGYGTRPHGLEDLPTRGHRGTDQQEDECADQVPAGQTIRGARDHQAAAKAEQGRYCAGHCAAKRRRADHSGDENHEQKPVFQYRRKGKAQQEGGGGEYESGHQTQPRMSGHQHPGPKGPGLARVRVGNGHSSLRNNP